LQSSTQATGTIIPYLVGVGEKRIGTLLTISTSTQTKA